MTTSEKGKGSTHCGLLPHRDGLFQRSSLRLLLCLFPGSCEKEPRVDFLSFVTQPGHKGQRCCPLGSVQCSLASTAGSNNRLARLVPVRKQVKHLAASLTQCQWPGVRLHFKDGLLSQPQPHLPSCSEPTLPPMPSFPRPHPAYQ